MFILAKIAVENPLDEVKQALEEKGHQVSMFTVNDDMKGCDVGIVRAMTEMNTEQYDFPIVSMEGMSVQDVVNDVEQRLSR
nr:YkuS family protein [Bacillus niameyensis]